MLSENILAKVEDFCRANNLLRHSQILLIACSGGPDSLALADIFCRLQEKYDLTLHIAHAEHGIRGASSLADAAFVENFCQERKLPFHIRHLNVPSFAKEHKLSEETAARRLRYDFLRTVAKEIHADGIVTAHHLNDQAETVLQHLLRGAGPQGLSGMKPVSGDILRPFLCLYRAEIEAYCSERQLKPRHDDTNLCTCYERNRIRLELMPQLEKYNGKAAAAICRSARLIADEHDFIIEYAKSRTAELSCKKDGAVSLSIEKLQGEHLSIRREIYRQAISEMTSSLADITFEHIEKIDSFLYDGHTGALLQLPGGIRITRSYEILKIFPAAKEGNTPVSAEYNIVASVNGSTLLPGGFVLSIRPVESIFPVKGRDTIFIDADKIAGRLIVRNRRRGDKITPKGMSGSKKIKDILIDSKIPAERRDLVPLVCDDMGIIWLSGIRQDARCVPEKTSSSIWQLQINKTTKNLD